MVFYVIPICIVLGKSQTKEIELEKLRCICSELWKLNILFPIWYTNTPFCVPGMGRYNGIFEAETGLIVTKSGICVLIFMQ